MDGDGRRSLSHSGGPLTSHKIRTALAFYSQHFIFRAFDSLKFGNIYVLKYKSFISFCVGKVNR